MQTSSNYSLKLPEGTDNVKRQDFVDNFTTIDSTMKAIDNKHGAYGTTSGTNTYTVSITGVISLYDGLKVTVKIGTASTGASTLNINGLGAKTILDSLGNAITSGGLKASLPYQLCYNGTNFIVLGKGGGGNVTSDKMLEGTTATGDSGPVDGSMPNKAGTNKALSINETWVIPEGYHDGNGKVTQSITTQAGSTTTPGTADKTIVSTNKYVTGDIKVKGDANLVAKNILDTVTLFGIKGTANLASLGGKRFATGTFVNSSSSSVTIELGFIPNIIVAYTENSSSMYGYAMLLFVRGGASYPIINLAFYSNSKNSYYYSHPFYTYVNDARTVFQTSVGSVPNTSSTYTYIAFE